MYEAPLDKTSAPHQHPVWELVYYRAGRIGCVVEDQTFEGILVCSSRPRREPSTLNSPGPRTPTLT
jgi:hypothetical protein